MKIQKVVIPARKLQHCRADERPVVRISSKAYNYLVDITNESADLNLASVVSSIVEQVVEKKLLAYQREEAEN